MLAADGIGVPVWNPWIEIFKYQNDVNMDDSTYRVITESMIISSPQAAPVQGVLNITAGALASSSLYNLDGKEHVYVPAANLSGNSSVASSQYSWGVLALSPLILASALGNILVCLAVCWDRKLQNMTNYFLMSLAMADLLVSLLVMPLAMVVEFYGYFPLQPGFCVFWATMDVFLCTASIWHMCTMSMDRFCTLKYPMRYGRNKTKTMVVVKITFVWLVSMSICSPLCVMGFSNHANVFSEGQCVPTIRSFVIYGSIFAFYVPLFIMVVTYVLTIQILCKNQQIMKHVAHDQTNRIRIRKSASPAIMTTSLGAFLSPFMPRFMERPSFDTSISNYVSVNESVVHSENSAQMTREADFAIDSNPGNDQKDCSQDKHIIPKLALVEHTPSQNSMNTVYCPSVANSSQSINQNYFGKRPMLSTSQPHLPSMSNRLPVHPSMSQHSLCYIAKAKSHLTVHDLESVRNYTYVSTATSLNSMLSRENWSSTAWSEFEDPEMFEKLSQIEAEMDECLMVTKDGHDITDATENESSSLLSVFTDTQNTFPVTPTAGIQVPPVYVSPGTPIPPSRCDDGYIHTASKSSSSTDCKSRSCSGSDQSGFITIQLKPSGCYMYEVDYSKSGVVQRKNSYEYNPSTSTSSSPSRSAKAVVEPLQPDGTTQPQGRKSTDEGNSDGVSSTTCSTIRKYSPNTSHHRTNTASSRGYSASAWKALLHRKKRLKKMSKSNGHIKQIISKRTASNERKASKVLGIIFAVFVVLWTPFFIVNILSVVCETCMTQITPAMMASIVWFGYFSSLANPIIYTMFNTAFRNAFVKILTCRHKVYRMESVYRTSARPKTPDSMYMTNMTSTFNQTPNGNRRSTNTVQLSPSLRTK